jgi:Icc-related predicted phosphoesterase
MVYGRYLDLFVSHAPAWGIHDGPDFPHVGIKAFRWLIQTFKPQFHLHGHIHVYNPATVTETKLGNTTVLNTYGYKVIEVDLK